MFPGSYTNKETNLVVEFYASLKPSPQVSWDTSTVSHR